METTFAQWAGMLRDQHGLLTRAQMIEHGVSDRVGAHHRSRRRWQRVLPGVHCVHTGPLLRSAVLTAALLYAGPHAVLSHRTAGEEWGMLRLDDDAPVHVTVPYGLSAVDQPAVFGLPGRVHPGVVVHRSRAQAHIVARTDPPRTSAADTVLDLAVAEPTAREAARRLVSAVTAGGVPVLQVRVRMELRRPRRYVRALTGALDLLAHGVASALEHRYAVDVEQTHGLPTAARQAPVVVDGHTLFEDCDYSATGVPLLVRLDGRRYHSAPGVAFRDRRRDNAAELAGRPRLVYGWTDVTTDPCGVAAEVAAVLVRGGARVRPTPCPRCA